MSPPPGGLDRRTALTGLTLAATMLPAMPACSRASSSLSVAPPAAGPVLRSSRFSSFAEAARRWRDTGGTLLVDRDHVEALPITVVMTPGLAYRLTTDGPRTLSYDGPQFHWFICLQSGGETPLAVDGNLTVDGRDNCSIPLFLRFETAMADRRRDLLVDGLAVVNARMKRGISPIDQSRTNLYGATGLAVSGGFSSVVLRRFRIARVTREAGAGIRGHQGCAGVAVTGATDGASNSARHVTIEDFVIERIDSDDPPGSPLRGDMDGIIVFQGAEHAGTRPVIRRGRVREAAGRAIKVFAPGGGGVTSELEIYRSVHGNTGGSNDIAHQHGDGVIENIVFHYSGNAHSQPTTPVGMSSGTPRAADFPFAEGIVRNITLHDTTGRPKRALATFFYNVPGDAAPRTYRLADLSDEGSAECLFRSGVLGTFGPAVIDIERVSVNLTAGLDATEDRTPHLEVRARRLVNRNGRPAPFKVAYNGNVAPPSYGGRLVVDDTVRGLVR